jgi:FkbM family methyltransferase
MNIFEFLKQLNPNLLIEIGAHFGTETLKFREMLPNARIICFEPDPRNINILIENGVDKICELERLAISDSNGLIDFHLSSGDCKHWAQDDLLRNNEWSASSSIKRPKLHLQAHPWVKFEQVIQVNSTRLDDYKPLENNIIDFIWMDVQGAEDLVFAGAKNTLKSTKYIYTEYNNFELYENQANLNKILSLIGSDWSIEHLYDNDVLLKNKNYEN